MSVTDTRLCLLLTLQSYHKLIVTEAVIQVVLYDPFICLFISELPVSNAVPEMYLTTLGACWQTSQMN